MILWTLPLSIIHNTCSLIFFCILNIPTLCCASDGTDLFIEACRLRGANPALIHSGSINYELTLQRLQNGKMLVGKSNEHILLSGNRNSNAKRKYEAWFEKSSPFYKNVAQPTQLLVQGRAHDQAPIIVEWQPGAKESLIREQRTVVPRFQDFGRMQGLPSWSAISMLLNGSAPQMDLVFPPDGIALYKKLASDQTKELGHSVHKIVGEARYDPGATAFIVESRTIGNKMLQRYWIDPSRGSVCPLIQIYEIYGTDSGALQEEYKSNDYFLHKESGLWYPAHYVEIKYNTTTHAIRESSDYKIDKASFQLNQFVSDSELSIDVPTDSFVTDSRISPRKVYKVAKKGTLSLAKGGLDVSSFSWLQVLSFGRGGFEAPFPRIGKSEGVRKDLLYPGLIILLLICVMALILRRRRKDHNVFLLVMVASLIHTGGCDARPDGDFVPKISIVPPTLNFGDVRATDSPVSLVFAIHNHADKALKIDDILSGCGCTIVNVPTEPIPAKGSVDVPVKVDLHGRSGYFSNRIIIKPHGDLLPLDAEIKGRVIQDIWYDGQAVRCVTDTRSSKIDRMFDIHTVDYPDIRFRFSRVDADMSVEEVSRATIAGETVIRLSLSMNAPKGGEIISKRLLLETDNNRVAPLNIPVLCYRSDEADNPTVNHNIKTKQVSIGAVQRNKETEFEIHGDPDIISAVKEALLQELANGFAVTLRPSSYNSPGVLKMTLLADKSAPDGSFKGYVVLRTLGNSRYRVPVIGAVKD
jgi:hypothetical protein